jgi:formyltetrahydrofolate hydrolase
MTEESSQKLKIKNHMCEMNGGTIKKITEIIYQNKKYIIEDNYTLNSLANEIQNSSSQNSREKKETNSTNDSDNKH